MRLVANRRTLETGDEHLSEEAVAVHFSYLFPFTSGREELARPVASRTVCLIRNTPETEQARKARVQRIENVLGAQAIREILELVHRDGRGVVVVPLSFHWDDVAHLAIRQILCLPMPGKEDKYAVFVLGLSFQIVA